jgi:hypothetical protein
VLGDFFTFGEPLVLVPKTIKIVLVPHRSQTKNLMLSLIVQKINFDFIFKIWTNSK